MWVNFRCKFLAEVGQFYARINTSWCSSNKKARTTAGGGLSLKFVRLREWAARLRQGDQQFVIASLRNQRERRLHHHDAIGIRILRIG